VSLSSAVLKVSDQLLAPAALPLEKADWLPVSVLNVVERRKILPLLELEHRPLVVKSVTIQTGLSTANRVIYVM
jgi:hypothetical protein